ncbi:hypothetical protein NX773_07680 [Massilia solisilvae]|uniref:DUF1640 domain-containing protein n=1 Tax=Massilia solisilvae TaxID=1811225 RepID=A0ABT2BIY8_9BURK|nr:hypothetical protein [Massilia solisilvae]MCS0608040.1 hypothetical protein [Massilia solisilvae]
MDSFEREQFFNLSSQIADLAKRADLTNQRLAVIESNYATRADVLESRNSLVMWIIGLGLFTQLAPYALKHLFG